MPYRFKFYVGDQVQFQCDIESQRCISNNKNGLRCNRKVCIGTKYCWTHLLYLKHLKIKNSTLPDAGKGLFAMNPALEANALIFRRGDLIIDYQGEFINDAELEDRYGEYTGTYAARLKRNVVEDCACERGVGSIANQANRANGNNAILRANYQVHPQRIQLKASRDIRNNLEIFVDYGDEYQLDEDTHSTTLPIK